MPRQYSFVGRLRALAASAAVCLLGAPAGAITIDGNLSDWGVSVLDGTSANPTPSNFSSPNPTGATLLGFQQEDQSDIAGHGGFVGPNYGGQDYDVEFAAAAISGNTLYMAFVSGLRPDNGFSYFGPGDIYILTSTGIFGIEVGGGAGGGPGGAQSEGVAGSTYTLNGSGITTGHSNSAGAQQTGTIWTNVTWLQDPIAPQTPVQFEINGASTQVGTANYVFTRDSATAEHSIIELSFDVGSILDGADNTIVSYHFGPTCGNDVLPTTGSFEVSVPEPGSLGLFAFGLAGLSFPRFRSFRGLCPCPCRPAEEKSARRGGSGRKDGQAWAIIAI